MARKFVLLSAASLFSVCLMVGCGGSKKSRSFSTTAPSSSNSTAAPTTSSNPTTPGLVPVLTLNQPTTTPAQGNVALTYSIADVDSDAATIAVEYSVDDGVSYATATDAGPSEGSHGTTGLSTSPTGASHDFVWASRQDLGNVLRSYVKIRITPSDQNGTGQAVETTSFVVDNTEQATRLVNMVIPVSPTGTDGFTAYDVDSQGGLSNPQTLASTGQGRQMSSASALVAAKGLVFASHNEGAEIETFLVDSSGALSAHPGGKTTTTGNPTRMAVTPNGKFLYTSNGTDVEGFEITPAGLTPIAGSPFAVGTSTRDLVVHPKGNVLFTGHMFGADTGVKAHTIDPTTGALTALTSLDLSTSGSRPGNHLRIAPGGNRLFCSDLDNGVFVIDVDPTTQALTVAGGAPVAMGAFLTGMTTTTRGDYVYVTLTGNSLHGFKVEANGSLTAVPGSPYTNVGNTSLYLQTDASDTLLFVSSRTDNTLRVYSIDPNYGMLTEVLGSPVTNQNTTGVVGPVLPFSVVGTTGSAGSTTLLSEDFTNGLGQFTNVTVGDDFDWTVHSGSTTSTNTGPVADHTTGSGNYIYTESSSPNYPNKVASIQSPAFANHTKLQVSFWYHMLGDAAGGAQPMGSLHLDVSTDGGASWTLDVWTRSGTQGASWNQATVDLAGYANQTVVVRFRVITVSYRSDVALDDIVVTDN